MLPVDLNTIKGLRILHNKKSLVSARIIMHCTISPLRSFYTACLAGVGWVFDS